MQFQKELAKISKDFARMSRKLQKLTASIPKQKSRAQKDKMQKPIAFKKGKKSGTQSVLDMIRKSKKGIGAGTLIKKTGFDDKRIRNIIFKAQKEGKIKRVHEEFIGSPNDHYNSGRVS